jgi:hypothetical protein
MPSNGPTSRPEVTEDLSTWFSISRIGCSLGNAIDVVEERAALSLIGPLGGIGMGEADVLAELDLGGDLLRSSVDAVSEPSLLISTRVVTI